VLLRRYCVFAFIYYRSALVCYGPRLWRVISLFLLLGSSIRRLAAVIPAYMLT